MPEPEASAVISLRAGLYVSSVSVVWTVVSSTAAVAIGLAAGSLVLVAFGLVGVLDAAGSATLIVHFRHALHHEAFSARHERIALRVVTLGLIVVGVATAAESIRRLIQHVHGSTVPAGVAIAAVSALALAALSHHKRRIGRAIPSQALLADGWLSATGALLAIATVLGTGLAAGFGWWWVDPVAATVVGAGAVTAGVGLSRG